MRYRPDPKNELLQLILIFGILWILAIMVLHHSSKFLKVKVSPDYSIKREVKIHVPSSRENISDPTYRVEYEPYG